MKTAVSQIIKELQEQFPKEMRDMYERNQLLLEDIALRAKEMEKEQREKDFISGYKKRAELSNLIYDEASELSAKELFNQQEK